MEHESRRDKPAHSEHKHNSEHHEHKYHPDHARHTKKHMKLKKTNIWMGISALLVIALIVSFYTGGSDTSNSVSGEEISKEETSEKALDYINTYLLGGGSTAEIKGVKEENGMHVITLDIQGQEFDSYITKDGKLLFPQAIDLDEKPEIPEVANQPQTETVVADPEELNDFVDCLKQADFKIYGASWCGWTSKLVDSFGGSAVVDPIYIECTEDQELCAKAGVDSYPTLFIGDKIYSGPRNFNGFAEATGCPITTNIVVTESAGGEAPSCG